MKQKKQKTHSELAAARFFLRIAQVGASQRKRDEESLPLFSLPLILSCEGTLSRDCMHLVGGERRA